MIRCILVWVSMLAALASVAARAAADGPGITTTPAEPTVLDEAVLFAFDNTSIAASDNLILTMKEPEKHAANPVVPLGARGEPDEWQQRYYGTVIRHAGKFKMWYIATSREGFLDPSTGKDIDFRGWRFAYAESTDGIRWVKPKLGLVEFRGSRENNLIGLPEGFRGYNACVLYEPEDADPTRRFKMMALLREFGEYTLVGGKAAWVPLYSADGLRWRVADELVPGGNKKIPGEHLVTRMEGSGLYKWKGMYYLSGQGGAYPAVTPYGRYVQTYRSPDLIHWSKTLTMTLAREGQMRAPTTDPSAQPGKDSSVERPEDIEQTHSGIAAWNRGNVLIGMSGMWHAADEWRKVTHDLGLVVSNDGLHFREPIPDQVFARVGPDGSWDEGGLGQGQGFENVGDKTYIWYGQMDQRYGTYGRRPWKRHGGIGLLVLDRDRFGSLAVRDPAQPAALVTSDLKTDRPVRFFVNAEGLSAKSSLRVELLDSAERPIAGFSGERAAIVTRSGLRVPVTWQGGDRPTELRQPFKIQVVFDGAERSAIELYAIYVAATQSAGR